MDIETGVMLDRSDFIGFEWIFEMHGILERLLDRIDCHDTPQAVPKSRSAG